MAQKTKNQLFLENMLTSFVANAATQKDKDHYTKWLDTVQTRPEAADEIIKYFREQGIITEKHLASLDTEKEVSDVLTTQNGQTTLGKDTNTGIPISIADSERQAGMYVVGVQGTGKSSFLETLIFQDIQKGQSVIVLDPHGDLIEHIIAELPENRLTNTYLLDMEDEQFPFGINLFTSKKLLSSREEAQAVDRVMHVFEVLWGDVLSQQHLPRYLRAATLTLLQNTGATLVDMYSFLQDDEMREKMLKKVTDISVKQFWEYQYTSLSPSVRRKEVSPLVNRLESLFMGRSLVRNIVGQRETMIDFRRSIEQKEIILLKLPIQTLRQDAALVGTLIVAAIHSAIFSFADMPLEKRPGFSLYIDEFQNFVTKDIEEIFTQGRKFGSRLCVAHQARYQIPDFLASATVTARSIIAFQTQAEDSQTMGKLYTALPQEIEVSDIEPRVVEYLVVNGHKNAIVDRFVRRYLLPLPSMLRGGKIEVTTWKAGLLSPNYYSGKNVSTKGFPLVESPVPYLNTLLREVQQTRNGRAEIPLQVLLGFSNNGSGYFQVIQKSENAVIFSLLEKPDALASKAELENYRSRLLGKAEQKDELLTFVGMLRAVMLVLAEKPLGERKSLTASDVGKLLVNLPQRTALVKIGENVAQMKTLDTPVAVGGGEVARRKRIIQEQTRKKYCKERGQVEKEMLHGQQETQSKEQPAPTQKAQQPIQQTPQPATTTGKRFSVEEQDEIGRLLLSVGYSQAVVTDVKVQLSITEKRTDLTDAQYEKWLLEIVEDSVETIRQEEAQPQKRKRFTEDEE